MLDVIENSLYAKYSQTAVRLQWAIQSLITNANQGLLLQQVLQSLENIINIQSYSDMYEKNIQSFCLQYIEKCR